MSSNSDNIAAHFLYEWREFKSYKPLENYLKVIRDVKIKTFHQRQF